MNIGEVAGPILSTLLSLLKVVAMIGVPLAVVVFFAWFAFVRWSQHGVDL